MATNSTVGTQEKVNPQVPSSVITAEATLEPNRLRLLLEGKSLALGSVD